MCAARSISRFTRLLKRDQVLLSQYGQFRTTTLHCKQASKLFSVKHSCSQAVHFHTASRRLNKESGSVSNPTNIDETRNPEEDKSEPEEKFAAELNAKDEQLKAKDEELEKLREYNDKLLRGLAELQNTMNAVKRDADNASKFAISKFAKDLLEVADSLELALNAVRTHPENKEDLPLGKLFSGVEMTQKTLLHVFERFGVKKFESLDQKFDPNLHDALFSYADENKPSGVVGQILKEGYTIHERLLRPAHVGVIKADKKPQAESSDEAS